LAVAFSVLLSGSAQSDTAPFVKLGLEERTTLRVGELAILSIPSDHHYSIEVAGNVLVPVRHSRSKVLYRAVRPGLETVLLSPDVAKGECIACATHHYFINVVPRS
jgi:hypothetical protein